MTCFAGFLFHAEFRKEHRKGRRGPAAQVDFSFRKLGGRVTQISSLKFEAGRRMIVQILLDTHALAATNYLQALLKTLQQINLLIVAIYATINFEMRRLLSIFVVNYATNEGVYISKGELA
jgi:hypothetical protein